MLFKQTPFAIVLLSLAFFGTGGSQSVAEDDEGWVSIFDGKTLDNWDGNPKFWSVKDGAITGQTTKDNPTNGNTFIIWRGGETADFELKLEYKIIDGNSGIQYRSFESTTNKWRVGGYQGDFEAGDTYSGILYGERFRGILARRGEKTVIEESGKPKVVGSVGNTKELQAKIKKEDWNEYHITAKGFHFQHRINGHLTVDVTDEDKSHRREKGILALQLHAGPPMTVQFRNIKIKHLKKEPEGADIFDDDFDFCEDKEAAVESKPAKKERKRVAFVAGVRSHGFMSHEHNAGCLLLANALGKALPNFDIVVYSGGWPKDPNALDGFDSIVMYSDGGGGHMVNRNLEQVRKLMDQGVGLVCIHYAVEVPKGDSGNSFLDWIGGYFEAWWSVNPHWTAEFKKLPDHPVANGVKPFSINDEWYYHMRFREGMKGVTPILTAVPPKSTLSRPDGAHSGNEHVRKTVGQPQHVAWASERDGNKGRGFGFTGGHFHRNWAHPDFRRVVLNAIVWTAGSEVPEGGVPLMPVTVDDLLKNQDYDKRKNFDRAGLQKMIDSWNTSNTSVATPE